MQASKVYHRATAWTQIRLYYGFDGNILTRYLQKRGVRQQVHVSVFLW